MTDAKPAANEILERLVTILNERKGADPSTSYVASLNHKGINAILKKVGEEATELVMAVKDGDRKAIVYETADLWFHSLIALVACDLSANDVLEELARRFDVSGHVEKASR